jgi:hypothetical protein
MIQVPDNYWREANDALYEALGAALGLTNDLDQDWDRVEAITNALESLALTFTRPKGPNT